MKVQERGSTSRNISSVCAHILCMYVCYVRKRGEVDIRHLPETSSDLIHRQYQPIGVPNRFEFKHTGHSSSKALPKEVSTMEPVKLAMTNDNCQPRLSRFRGISTCPVCRAHIEA